MNALCWVINLCVSGLLVWWGNARFKRAAATTYDDFGIQIIFNLAMGVWCVALMPLFMSKAWKIAGKGSYVSLINPTFLNLCIIITIEILFTIAIIVLLSYISYKKFNCKAVTIYDTGYNDRILEGQYLPFDDFKALYPIWKETVHKVETTEGKCYYKICRESQRGRCYFDWQKIYFKTYLDYLKYRIFVRGIREEEAREEARKNAEKRHQANLDFLTLQQKLINRYNEKLTEELKNYKST